jgi:folate-binding protein YgfZ
MLSLWQPLLDATATRLIDGTLPTDPAHADFAALARQTVFALLPDYRLLTLNGPDASRFLQGQLTCDVEAISADRASLAAHCNPKGRMLSSFVLGRDAGGGFWLRLRSDLVEIASQQLGKYLVFSKAKLAPAEQHLVVGLSGAAAGQRLREAFGVAPSGARFASVAVEGGLLVQLDEAGQRFEGWLTPTAALSLQRHCADLPVTGDAFWRWLSIADGIAELAAATSELFIPQMLNYPQLGGVSFSKGCYTGQEIVARAHYRGQVKRHLLRAELDGDAPAAGSELLGANGRSAGQVVDAVARAPGCSELLAVVGDSDEALLSVAGAPLRPLPLPYSAA